MNTVALDVQLELIADSQRRDLLISLLDTSPLNDLVCDGGVSMRTDETDPTVAMHHVHLPKLAAADVVTWDREGGRVARGPAFDDVRPLLTLLDENEQELPGHVVVT